jgi:PTH1 family peptidyl-tRNA hydrolase
MKLIVGLGNPGPRYADTRHNVGWRVAEMLAARAGAGPWREKYEAAVAEARWSSVKVAFARPLVYMNNSGLPVRQLTDFWKVESADLLVVSDDLALDLGRMRLRGEGSAGGHNGLASIVAHLGHDQFGRLRVGIGPAPPPAEHAAFVLSEFTAAERPVIEAAIACAADAAECWMTEGLQEAMNRFNRAQED